MKYILFILFFASSFAIAQTKDSREAIHDFDKNYYSFLDRKIINSDHQFSFSHHSLLHWTPSISPYFSAVNNSFSNSAIQGATSFITSEGHELIDGFYKYKDFSLGNLNLKSISTYEFDFLGNLRTSEFSISFK